MRRVLLRSLLGTLLAGGYGVSFSALCSLNFSVNLILPLYVTLILLVPCLDFHPCLPSCSSPYAFPCYLYLVMPVAVVIMPISPFTSSMRARVLTNTICFEFSSHALLLMSVLSFSVLHEPCFARPTCYYNSLSFTLVLDCTNVILSICLLTFLSNPYFPCIFTSS